MKQKKTNNKKSFNLFKGLYKILDKIIITPFAKVFYYISDKLQDFKSGRVERILSNQNSLLIISLLFAYAAYYAISIKGVDLVATESVVLTGQIINVEYNEEAYVLEGVPESADIVLMGSKNNLYLAEQLGDHKLTLDLSGLGEGTHKVSLKYNNPIKALDYKLDPSNITVVVRPKVSESRTLTKDILNTDKLDNKLVISSVTLDRDEVIIKSYKEKLATVASVKAIIDVNALSTSQAGTYTLDKVKLVAYDENGTEISGIQIVPQTISATVIITSPSKEVPVKIVPVGEVATGSAISSITASVTRVILYGEESVLNEINDISVEIDVNGLSADKVYKENIIKPNGIRSMSEDFVTIKVIMEKETSKKFTNIPIQFENLDTTKYSAFGETETDTKVDVTVKGVSDLLDKLANEDIKAYIDLSDLGEGKYEVPVEVTGSDLRLSYSTSSTKVTVVIKRK